MAQVKAWEDSGQLLHRCLLTSYICRPFNGDCHCTFYINSIVIAQLLVNGDCHSHYKEWGRRSRGATVRLESLGEVLLIIAEDFDLLKC